MDMSTFRLMLRTYKVPDAYREFAKPLRAVSFTGMARIAIP